jgi:hypothetical protein
LGLRRLDSEALGHGFVEEAFARAVGLDPFAVDDELWDGALAGAFDDFVDGAGGGLDVDFFESDVVFGEEAFGLAAVRAPGGGIDSEFHGLL